MEARPAINDDELCQYCQNPNGCTCTSRDNKNALDQSLNPWDTNRCLNCGKARMPNADLCEDCMRKSRVLARFKRVR